MQQQDEENDPHFEPVIRLTEQVETKTMEENEDPIFKMYVLAFPSIRRNPSDDRISTPGGPNCSDSIPPPRNGKKGERAMFVSFNTGRQ